MEGKQLKIFSANINSLNSPQKRKRTFLQLKKLQAEIICLQETHMKEHDCKLLNCKQLGQVFVACDKEKKKRGLAIYVKDHLHPRQIYATEDGRMLLVEIQRGDKNINS